MISVATLRAERNTTRASVSFSQVQGGRVCGDSTDHGASGSQLVGIMSSATSGGAEGERPNLWDDLHG